MRPSHDEPPAREAKTAPGSPPALISGGELPPGYVVGEYRVEQVIGQGGMGVVYAGVQPVIEKRVAIKVLNSELSADPALVRRFMDEARAVNRIRHPNIIDIFSFGQLADGRQYFVMEYLEGHALADRLKERDLALVDAPLLLGQICDALDAAHAEHIVHRDLKPENIWIVEPRRGRPFVKLLDFGIAKLLATGDQTTTQAGVLMGTPQYMSPEQCHGRAVDSRTDIYAMGVLLYELYTGQLPFRGESFTEILTKQLTEMPERPSTIAPVPMALDELIMRCLAKDPAARPQTARELGEALASLLRAPPTAIGRSVVSPATAATAVFAPEPPAQLAAPASRPARRWLMLLLLVFVGAFGAWAATRLAGQRSAVVQPAGVFPPVAPSPSPASMKSSELVPEARPVVPAAVVPPTNLAPREQPASQEAVAPAPGPVVRQPTPSKTGKRTTATRAGGDGSRASTSGLVVDNPFR